MFAYYSIVEMGLIALIASTALFIWSIRSEGLGKYLAGVVGFLAMIFSVFIIFSATFCSGEGCTYHLGKVATEASHTMTKEVKVHKK